MRGSRLQAVADDELELEQAQPAAQPAAQTAAIQMLTMALKALSQRAIIALSNLFMLLTAFSVFILWFEAPADPSISQIIRLALYALFVLALNLIKRK